MSIASTGSLKRSPMPRIAGPGFLAVAKYNMYRWDRALDRLQATQLDQLFDIVRHAAGTEFGRAHNFDKIRSYEDFRASVPVGDYDSFSPAIERMREGEKNLLVPEFVKYFGNSSGSSTGGKSKFLPVTERQLRHQRAGSVDALFRYLVHKNDAHFTDGYYLGLFPPITMKKHGKTLVTNNPALMIATMPHVGRLMYLPDRETMKLEDYDKKLEIIADRYLDYDVRMITGTTCWFSVLFDKLLAAARRKGRKATTVIELWPNLSVLIGGGVAAGPYLGILKERLGTDRVALVDTYNASEGGIYACTNHAAGNASGLEGGGDGMLMVPHRGVFYEFIPHAQLESERPKRVPLWEVEPDELYAIVVTTPSGLYSYLLGDLVRFPSIKPLHIEFAGRLSGCLSTTRELTTHVEIQKAFAAAVEAAGGTAVDFTAGADVGVDGTAKSRYIVFAEFTEGGVPKSDETFIRAFDDALCTQNRVYREHRKGGLGILAPELVRLPSGSVAKFMNEIGNISVQTKFPRILDEGRKKALRTYGGASHVGAF